MTQRQDRNNSRRDDYARWVAKQKQRGRDAAQRLADSPRARYALCLGAAVMLFVIVLLLGRSMAAPVEREVIVDRPADEKLHRDILQRLDQLARSHADTNQHLRSLWERLRAAEERLARIDGRSEEAQKEVNDLRNEVAALRHSILLQHYVYSITEAAAALENREWDKARAHLREVPPEARSTFEYNFLTAWCQSHAQPVSAMRLSGKATAVAQRDGLIATGQWVDRGGGQPSAGVISLHRGKGTELNYSQEFGERTGGLSAAPARSRDNQRVVAVGFVGGDHALVGIASQIDAKLIIRYFDTKTGAPAGAERVLETGATEPLSPGQVAFIPARPEVAAVVTADGKPGRVVRVRSDEQPAFVGEPGSTGPFHGVTFSADGESLLATGEKETLVWTGTAAPQKLVTGPGRRGTFSPRGGRVAVAADPAPDGTTAIRIASWPQDHLCARLVSPRRVTCLCFLDEGHLVLGAENEIEVWSVAAEPKLLLVLRGNGRVSQVVADGHERLLSLIGDTVQVWETSAAVPEK